MRILMTGGTGFVGTMLSQDLAGRGHQVTVLTRPGEESRFITANEAVTPLEGDPTGPGAWQEEAAEHEVFINLAGASIFSRWSQERKEAIRKSRIATTNNLVEAIAHRKGKTTTLLSTSAVGYYGFHGDEMLNETCAAGSDFLATVAAEWENAAFQAEKYGARVVICRFGIVLGKGGGALGQMIPLFRYRMGSPLGSGNQWFSWIHERDLANIYSFLIEKTELAGPINCTAPNPVKNRDLTRALGKALGKPVFLPPVPSFMIRLVLGEFGGVLLKGQRVIPERLLKTGFGFTFPTIDEALRDVVTG
jgi:uncharacterized protein (TIGR01777 family)